MLLLCTKNDYLCCPHCHLNQKKEGGMKKSKSFFDELGLDPRLESFVGGILTDDYREI